MALKLYKRPLLALARMGYQPASRMRISKPSARQLSIFWQTVLNSVDREVKWSGNRGRRGALARPTAAKPLNL